MSAMELRSQETSSMTEARTYHLNEADSTRKSSEVPNQSVDVVSKRIADLESQVATLRTELKQEKDARQAVEAQAEATMAMLIRTNDEILKRLRDLDNRTESQSSRADVVSEHRDRFADRPLIFPRYDVAGEEKNMRRPRKHYSNQVVGPRPRASDEAIRLGSGLGGDAI
jgi:uncharacterized small protein (DUF1192 family)